MNGPLLLSATPGRTRLRGASANGPLAPTAACAALQDVPGVRQVDTYPRTRSVVVRFDAGETSPEVLLGVLGQLAVGGGAAALVLNRAAPSLGRAGREALIAGTVGAMHLSQKLREFAEEARLGLDDIAAEARARGGQTSPDAGAPASPPDGGASH